MLKYKELNIKNLDFIYGTINGTPVKGRIKKLDGNFYFLQNVEDGGKPSDGNLMGFRHSWSFKKNKNGTLTQGVVIISVAEETRKAGDIGSIVERVPIRNASSGVIGYQLKLSKSVMVDVGEGVLCEIKHPLHTEQVNLFKEKAHPDCCGCTILYNFDSSEKLSYSRYKNIKDKDIENIKDFLASNPAKLVHLSHKQKASQDFVKRLGFRPVYEYVNANSRNTITVFHLNSSIEKPESEKVETIVAAE